MVGMISHPLKKIADNIVVRVRPIEDQDDVRRLLYSAVLFIKRVETGDLTRQEKRYESHPKLHFSEIAISTEIADSLRERMRILDDYRIQSVSRIQEMLLLGLERTSRRILTQDEIAILECLATEPMTSITHLGSKTKKSRYIVAKTLKKLEDEIGLRRLYYPNLGKLKFTTFSLVFQTRSYEESKSLEAWVRQTQPPFVTALLFDVSYRNGFITYAIPSQQRALKLFEHRVRKLKNAYLQQVQLQQSLEMYWNVRFELYDSQRGTWQIPPELEDISRLQLPSETSAAHISYSYHANLQNTAHFDQVDFLLANLGITPHHTLVDLHNELTKHGFALSRNAIWLRLNRLKQEEIIAPMMYFSGVGFEEFVCLSVICPPKTQRQIQLLTSYLPANFTYITKQGIAVFIKRPTGWRDFINKLIQDIIQLYEITDFIVIHQERNIGSGLQEELYSRWNEKRQYWEFADTEI
jgi:hypothetical protein